MNLKKTAALFLSAYTFAMATLTVGICLPANANAVMPGRASDASLEVYRKCLTDCQLSYGDTTPPVNTVLLPDDKMRYDPNPSADFSLVWCMEQCSVEAADFQRDYDSEDHSGGLIFPR